MAQNKGGTIEDDIFYYFTWIWLKEMGYGSSKNRKYLQRMVRLELGEESIYNFLKFYKALPGIKLDSEDKKHLLIETCKNGWQFFIRYIFHNQLLTQQPNKLLLQF